MSIEEIETTPTVRAASKVIQQTQKRWQTALRSPLWLCLLIALVIRIWLTYHTHGVIDGDEAMVGIQAEHILRGEHPYYFYGQAYMGSLEAYLMALLFLIGGPTVWMMRAEPILLSLLVVWLTWKLAGALAEAAGVSRFARQLFQTIAALLAAIPPLYDTVVELRTLGGYIETFVLMLLLLLAAFQITRRWQAGASNKEMAWRWAGIGFVIGFGFWINPLILIAVLAAFIWIIVFLLVELVRLSRQRETNKAQRLRPFLQRLLLAVTGIPACIIGLAPALKWGLSHQWANFTFALQLGQYQALNPIVKKYYPDRLSLFKAQVYLYQRFVAPRVISGALPGESSFLATIHVLTLSLGLCCLVVSVFLFVLSLFWRHPHLIQIRQLVALPLLFTCCVSLSFCTSIAAATGLISFQHDIAGRYAAPLMLVLPFFFAAVFTFAITYLFRAGAKIPLQAVRKGKGVPGKVAARILPRVALIAQISLSVVLLTYFAVQVASYGLSDPDATFLSPSCTIAPASNDAIIAYLQKEHVHYAWAIQWVGNPIIFKTNNSIILADPRVIIFHYGLGRIQAYTEALLHADRPSMLSIVPHNKRYPAILRIMDAQHVTYHMKRFPSEPGYDIIAVTSLSQRVAI
jgi:hypothetical protein